MSALCISCRSDLARPHDLIAGTRFTASGNYGSGLFDPFPTARVVWRIQVCDDCLVAAGRGGAVTVLTDTTERTHEERVWNPEEER